MNIKSHLRRKYALRQGNFTEIVLSVNPVIITPKSIMKTNVLDVINSIGSSLGLWLGFSIFTIFQHSTGIMWITSHAKGSYIWPWQLLDLLFSLPLLLSLFTVFFNEHFKYLLYKNRTFILFALFSQIKETANHVQRHMTRPMRKKRAYLDIQICLPSPLTIFNTDCDH